jgi:hypothetical protein
MIDELLLADNQIQYVSNFQELITTPFYGSKNANCFTRKLIGDFSEIVNKLELNGNISTIEQNELRKLELSKQGDIARNIILDDWQLLKVHGASPILNLIKCYDRDTTNSFFPTDVYSFHVDSSPVPADTFLCTYYGESSEILPNEQAIQKILIPEIYHQLKKHFNSNENGFDNFLVEHFFDLHYQAKPNAKPINLGIGNLWRLAVQHPESKVQPCIHRAPIEKSGQNRLMMIC